jgi:sugar/nucleoside kinase (ribokinase family)
MSTIAVIGNLSRDIVGGAEPRPGGGVFYATRALAGLRADAHVVAACAAEDRDDLLPPLEAFGLPVTWHEAAETTAYTFHYEGDRRIMRQDSVGDTWAPTRAVEAAGDAVWVNVCALVRTHFPPETLAALAADERRLLVDAQGLVRRPEVGPLRTDGFIGDALDHIVVLKLNDEEAETLVGSAEPEKLRGLGVPEVLLTLGPQGAYVVTSDAIEHLPADPVDGPVDPTGAGDTFSAGYLTARIAGAEPVEAARAATATAGELLRSF